MQNRRDFLKHASVLLAGTAISSNLFSSCSSKKSIALQSNSASKKIGLQLYSLRDLVKDEGIQKTLETVSKMGYKNLELAGYNDGKMYGLAPAELKKMVGDLGMRVTSSHVGQAYNKEKEDEVMGWWDQAIDAHNEMGVKYMIQPWMPVNDKTTLDDLKTYCDYFNTVGYKTAAASIAFGYHNHDFEFKNVEGQRVYDFLLKNTSKNHVFFQMDVYWVVQGGADPVEYMKNYADQMKVLHIKDEKEIGRSKQIDYKPIFDQMYANNVKDYFVEVERYSENDPVASVTESFKFLNNANYVK